MPVQIRQLARQRRVIRGEVVDIGIRQRRREALHDRVLAIVRFVFVQRACDVVGVLPREARVLRIDAGVAVGAVAGGTGRRLRLAGLDVALRRRGAGDEKKRERERAWSRFIAEFLVGLIME